MEPGSFPRQGPLNGSHDCSRYSIQGPEILVLWTLGRRCGDLYIGLEHPEHGGGGAGTPSALGCLCLCWAENIPSRGGTPG